MKVTHRALHAPLALIFLVFACLAGCADAASESTSPWGDPADYLASKPIDGTPVIRLNQAGDIKFDGELNEDAWAGAKAYTRFGLGSGTGLLSFPTSLRLLRNGRVIWLGIECTIPPNKKGQVPAAAMKKELIEIWIDKGPSLATFYQFMFKPVGAKISLGWIPKETIEKGFQVKTKVTPSSYTAEVRIDLDALNDFGPQPGQNVAFNMARACSGGWASLAGVVEHVHKPNQFWLLDLAETETPIEPNIAYRDPFKPGTDVVGLAKTLQAEWKKANFPREGKPWARMQAMMDSLAGRLRRHERSPWGIKNTIAVLSWRAITGWRTNVSALPMSQAVQTLEAKLADYPGGTYLQSQWREDAYISEFDGTAQPYAIFTPKNHDGKTPLPLVVLLHGSGRSHQGEGAVIERYWDENAPYIKVRPKARQCGMYGPLAMRDVLDVIDDVSKHHPVDADRIYLVGYSAGGFAAPRLAADYPHKFAGIAMVAGGVRRDRLENLKNMHVLVSHGRNDSAAAYDRYMSASFLRMRDLGVPVTGVILPATGHGIATSGYAEHMFKHKRNPSPDSVACLTGKANPKPLRAYWTSLLELKYADQQGGVNADIIAEDGGYSIRVQTANVTAFSLDAGDVADKRGKRPASIVVDDQAFAPGEAAFVRFTHDRRRWSIEPLDMRPEPNATVYRAGGMANLLETGSLLIVAPKELMGFVEKLKRQRIGDLRSLANSPVKLDTEVTGQELAANHIVLVGGPKLNHISREFMEALPHWPLPRKGRAFLLYDRPKKANKELGFDDYLIGVVTLNPLNPKLRVWAIICDSPNAFSEPAKAAKAVATPRHRYDRQADITVVDAKTSKLIEHRTMRSGFRPKPDFMDPLKGRDLLGN